mgnify:FL=1
MGGYLGFMADVARAQASAYVSRSAPPVDAALLAAARDHGMPPIAATSHKRDPAWRDDLRQIVVAVQSTHANLPVLATLQATPAEALEDAADRLLAGTSFDDEAATTPFIGAALQVYFTRIAESLPLECLERIDVPTVCPACGTRPLASIVRVANDGPSLRFLSCGLCHVEWNLPRIKCSSCGKESGLQYFSLETPSGQNANKACQVEACDDCKLYLKIFHQEHDIAVDPLADDLASLALDLLVDERGYTRSGPNLLFHPGSG